jgi:hypothetical protein
VQGGSNSVNALALVVAMALIATIATEAAAANLDFIGITILHSSVLRNRNGSHRSSTMPDGNWFGALENKLGPVNHTSP